MLGGDSDVYGKLKLVYYPPMLVSLPRDGDDFVVTFYPEDAIAFRYPRAKRPSKGMYRPWMENHQRQFPRR